MNKQVTNPYKGNASVAKVPERAVEVQRAIAEVKAAALLAREFPRDREVSCQRIISECMNIELARVAAYRYPRGGETVTGPSIRLAEVIAQNWGNIQFGWDEVERREGQSELVAWAWDIETNTRRSTTFFVKHWRDKKSGGYMLKDERDIYELCANMAARRLRACLLAILPKEVVETAIAQCKKTVVENELITPERVAKMITAFGAFGVSQKMIEGKLGHATTELTGAEIMELMEIYTSLKDGESKADQFFAPEQAPTPHDPETGEVTEAPSDWDAQVEELLVGVNSAKNEAELNSYLEEVGDSIDKLSKSRERNAISKWATGVNRKRETLKGK